MSDPQVFLVPPGVALRRAVLLVVSVVLSCSALLALAPEGQAAVLPPGFQDTVELSGLNNPTVFRFSPDGRVFVGEKSGLIKVFENLDDPTPSVFADLRTNVHNFWDRGLLGLALAPNFPTDPSLYVLYTYDAAIGGTAPRWGTSGATDDGCPTPPGPNDQGCVASGRISKLTASGNVASGPEQVLINDWCIQFVSHTVGDLVFGPDGQLYATGGEGASPNYHDYGQTGNPCGDPPSPAGTNLLPPTAEGGALRSQSVRREAGAPVSLDGALLRVEPATGAASAGNPFINDPNVNRRRVVAYGLRNPFRFTFRPGTSEAWIGDVGSGTWEEINRLVSPTAPATNFGWPCYEGTPRYGGFDSINLNLCETLYEAGTATAPYYAYNHTAKVVPGESCPTGGSAITGIAFYDRANQGGNYPTSYTDTLFFADQTRDCIWAMHPGTNGLPRASGIETFVSGALNPVDLQIGPGGDLYYVDLHGGTIHRIRYTSANNAPTARVSADPTSGSVPLTVAFNGSASSDPDAGDHLRYAWDLDGDGAFDDGTSATPSFTYTMAGTHTARLRVTDDAGATDTASVTVSASNSPPVPTIDSPASSLTWKVGDTISFSGHATDPDDGAVPAGRLRWDVIIQHCPSNCHSHVMTSFDGVASGSFNAPDHEHPSHVQLRLTVTDSTGASASTSVDLQPRTVDLSFQSSPGGLSVATPYGTRTTPYTQTVIAGSSNSISAVSPQSSGGKTYAFSSWSDGGAATHQIAAPASGSASYTATFSETAPPGLVAAYGFNEGSGTSVADASGSGNGGSITGASWTAGRYGGGLSFNGLHWVTVPDANSLDLDKFTISAWVKPALLQSGWRSVVLKEKPGALAYALYGHGASPPVPAVYVENPSEVGTGAGPSALPAGQWSYLTGTYDGSVLRLYVDGQLKASRNTAGTVTASTGPLRIGGNSVWGEWFNGALDEIRIYNRALNATEIAADRDTAIP